MHSKLNNTTCHMTCNIPKIQPTKTADNNSHASAACICTLHRSLDKRDLLIKVAPVSPRGWSEIACRLLIKVSEVVVTCQESHAARLAWTTAVYKAWIAAVCWAGTQGLCSAWNTPVCWGMEYTNIWSMKSTMDTTLYRGPLRS